MSDRRWIVRLNKRNRCVLLYHKAQATAHRNCVEAKSSYVIVDSIPQLLNIEHCNSTKEVDTSWSVNTCYIRTLFFIMRESERFIKLYMSRLIKTNNAK